MKNAFGGICIAIVKTPTSESILHITKFYPLYNTCSRNPFKFDMCTLSFEEDFFFFLFLFNVPVNNFSVMLRRSHLFLGITSAFGE